MNGDPNPTTRVPAEMFHPSVFILDEIKARGWTLDDLAIRMGGDFRVNRIALDLYVHLGPDDPDLLLGDGEDFARAFGGDATYWCNLESGWRQWKKAHAAQPIWRPD